MIQKKQIADLHSSLTKYNGEKIKSFSSLSSIINSFEELRCSHSDISSDTCHEDDDVMVVTGSKLTSCFFSLLDDFADKFKTLDDELHLDTKKHNVIFFLAIRGGLCNRLRSIAALRIIANRLNIEFKFIWLENQSCTGGITNISNIPDFTSVGSLIELLDSKNQKVYLESQPYSEWIFYDQFKEVAQLGSFNDFYNQYCYEASLLLNQLLLNNGLIAEIDNYQNINELNEYLAVHVRRTDFISHYKKVYPDKKLPSIPDYINKIKRFSDKQKIYLSTDEIGTIEKFKKKLPHQIYHIENIKFNSQNLRQTSFKHSLMDLAMLSRSEKIIITPGSSFSNFAVASGNTEVLEF